MLQYCVSKLDPCVRLTPKRIRILTLRVGLSRSRFISMAFRARSGPEIVADAIDHGFIDSGMVGRLLVVALLWCAPPPLTAQTVIVRAVEAETRRPVAGAIIRLADTAGNVVAAGFTTEAGRVVLRPPGRGRFKARADRIGHPGAWSGLFDLRDTALVDIEMPLERVILPELSVRGSTSCAARADGAETAALWEEVGKALAAGQITSEARSVEVAVRRFRKYRTRSGALLADSTIREFRTTASPFVSPPPAMLSAEGYIRAAAGGGFEFRGPDAATLLSREFLELHCFEVVRQSGGLPGLVGLAFRPTKDVKRPDVQGVIWVDRSTAELRYLEFVYANVPVEVRAPGIGGRLDFVRLPGGQWIVADWYIRTPNQMVVERRVLTRLSVRDSLVGYVDQGGSSRPVGDVTLALGEVATQLSAATTVTGDFRVVLVTPEGTPVPGASVAIAEADTVLTANEAGRFELRNLPTGKLSVRIRAVGFRPFVGVLVLGGERRLVDTTLVLQRAAQLLDSVVVTAPVPVFVSGKMIDVERRRQAGFGKFLTRAQLHDPLQGGLDTQLRRFARIRLAPRCYGRGFAPAAAFRSEPPVRVKCPPDRRFELPDCFVAVYVDGSVYWSPEIGQIAEPPDFSTFKALDFEAVEIYRDAAELPIEYSGPSAGCGAILLWTRVR